MHLATVHDNLLQDSSRESLALLEAHRIELLPDHLREVRDPAQEIFPSQGFLLLFLESLQVNLKSRDSLRQLASALFEFLLLKKAALKGVEESPPLRFCLLESSPGRLDLCLKETLLSRLFLLLLVRPQEKLWVEEVALDFLPHDLVERFRAQVIRTAMDVLTESPWLPAKPPRGPPSASAGPGGSPLGGTRIEYEEGYDPNREDWEFDRDPEGQSDGPGA